jgi:hypothetical protein
LQSQEDETLTGRRDTTNQSFLANHWQIIWLREEGIINVWYTEYN